MKKLPLWPFLAFRTIVESVSSKESVSDWGITQRSVVQIHPPQPFTDLRDYRRSPQFQLTGSRLFGASNSSGKLPSPYPSGAL